MKRKDSVSGNGTGRAVFMSAFLTAPLAIINPALALAAFGVSSIMGAIAERGNDKRSTDHVSDNDPYVREQIRQARATGKKKVVIEFDGKERWNHPDAVFPIMSKAKRRVTYYLDE